MPKMTLSIPSLTGGVSTQPEPLRLPQQAQVSNNMVASVVEGLRKRSPTEYQGILSSYPLSKVVNHPIHGDDGDYLATFSTSGLAVYDINSPGQPLTLRNTRGAVASAADLSYLDTDDPQRDLRFLTLSDYTLVLNRAKVTQAKGTTSIPESRGLIHVRTGAYRKQYRVKVVGPTGSIEVEFGTYGSDGTPPNTVTAVSPPNIPAAEDSVKTESIARQLELLLTTGTTSVPFGGSVISGNSSGLPPQDWTIIRSGSVISIERLDGADFTLDVTDSAGDTLMQAIHEQVQLFSDLPVHAWVGMKVEIIGDPSDPDAGYWAEFVPHRALRAPGFSDGYWRETVAPNIGLGLDPLTMPHALIRQANGEFQWTPLDGLSYVVDTTEYEVPTWALRTAGDATSNRLPAFVDQPIRDMCYHEGRLGLLSADTLSLSETREPFNFFRTTVVDSLDTERIELKASEARETPLSHAVPLAQDILIFGDGLQLIARSAGPMTPNSVSLSKGGRYDTSPDAVPIQVGDAIHVATDRSGRAAIHEFTVQGDERPRLERVDLTAVATDYVGRARTLTTTPQLNMVAVTSDDERSLWVYTYYFSQGDRVMQAWQKFTFRGEPRLRHAWFEDTDLYLVLETEGIAKLLKMRCAPYASDDGSPLVHLDDRVDNTQAIAVQLNVLQTALILPFEPTDAIRVVEKGTGREIQVSLVAGGVVVVEGDHRTTEFWAGEEIDCRHDLSKIQRYDENNTPVIGPELHLDSATLHYDESGPFDVLVIADDGIGEEFVTRFMGPYLGVGANYQKIRPHSGRLKVGIRGRSQDRRLSIRSQDPWPLRIVSLDIQASEMRQYGARV